MTLLLLIALAVLAFVGCIGFVVYGLLLFTRPSSTTIESRDRWRRRCFGFFWMAAASITAIVAIFVSR